MTALGVALAIGLFLMLGVRRVDPEALGSESIDARGTVDDLSGVLPEIRAEIEAKVAEQFPPTATVVHTADALRKLIVEKLPGWPWAAFVSVLVQRRAAVQGRLRDSRLGFAVPTGEFVYSDGAVARFVVDRMSELTTHLGQLEEVMHSPAFVNVVGAMARDRAADPGDILHTANRLMDIHDRFLQLAERCRGVQVPSEHAPLLRDCARLASVPLDGYQKFIDDFTVLIAKVPGWLYYSEGDVHGGQVVLDIDVDDDVLERRIFTRVRRLLKR